MAKHVLVPVEGSYQSAGAVAFASAEWPDARLTLLHVVDPVEGGYSLEAMREGAEEWHREQKLAAQDLFAELSEGVENEVSTRVETGRPARTILHVLEEGEYDHVAMGSHGRSGVSRVLLGSVAEDVVRESPVPVTIVRHPDADDGEGESESAGDAEAGSA